MTVNWLPFKHLCEARWLGIMQTLPTRSSSNQQRPPLDRCACCHLLRTFRTTAESPSLFSQNQNRQNVSLKYWSCSSYKDIALVVSNNDNVRNNDFITFLSEAVKLRGRINLLCQFCLIHNLLTFHYRPSINHKNNIPALKTSMTVLQFFHFEV